MPKKAEPSNWEEYMKAHQVDIPEGKENEYIAKAIVGYQHKNQNPPVPYSKKKAEKDASTLMKNSVFRSQMKDNQAEMLAMMAAGQYDALVRQTISPIPVVKNDLKTAYDDLERVQKKMAEDSYGIKRTQKYNLLCSQVDQSVKAKKLDPEMSEAMQIVNLLKVYTAFKDYEATVPKNSPEGKKLMNFGFDLMTALGGGPEVTQKTLDKHYAEANREMEEMNREITRDLERRHPTLSAPTGPSL